jgi:hypothetical protein
MTFDIGQYSDDIANAEFDRVDRAFMEEGTHLIRIEGVPTVTSKNTGNDLVILEAQIVSSDYHASEAPVKHLFHLSGVKKWMVQRNLSQLKSIVAATLPPEARDLVTTDIVNKAFREGLCIGAVIKVIVQQKESLTTKKPYLKYSFLAGPEELNRGDEPETEATAPSGNNWNVSEGDDASDDDGADVPF